MMMLRVIGGGSNLSVSHIQQASAAIESSASVGSFSDKTAHQQHKKVCRVGGGCGGKAVDTTMNKSETPIFEIDKGETDGCCPLDKQDSSYFSDSDCSHSELSRNVSSASDTLAVETGPSTSRPSYQVSPRTSLDRQFSEQLSLVQETEDASTLETSEFEEDYRWLLLQAVKLGYSEPKLQQVVQRFGGIRALCEGRSSQDRLDRVLTELMKLGQDVKQDTISIVTPSAAAAVDANANNVGGLRSIVIDGSNVAMTHGHKQVYSCLGIRDCVEWFQKRGHNDVIVFVPQYRNEDSRPDAPITDKHILDELAQAGLVVFTPSRRVGARRIVCYDDRYIIKTAIEKDAIIVSNDEYRDLAAENVDYRKAIEERLLMYSIVDGKFVPPDDPMGRYGPKLDQFLRKANSPASVSPRSGNGSTNQKPCPYGRKCTYGNKCKFGHPERIGGVHRSVTERLLHHAAEQHRKLSPQASYNCGETHPKRQAERTVSLNPAWIRNQSPSPNQCGGSASNGSTSPSSGHHLSVDLSPTHLGLCKQHSNPESWHHLQVFQQQQQQPHQQQFQTQAVPILMPTSTYIPRLSAVPQGRGNSLRVPTQHPPLGRFSSAPGAGRFREPYRRSSNSDSHLNQLYDIPGSPLSPVAPDPSETNFFIPSTNLWGPLENSVQTPIIVPQPPQFGISPNSANFGGGEEFNNAILNDLSAPLLSLEERSRFYFHMASVFGEDIVRQVMQSNPNISDPNQLGAMICQLAAVQKFAV